MLLHMFCFSEVGRVSTSIPAGRDHGLMEDKGNYYRVCTVDHPDENGKV